MKLRRILLRIMLASLAVAAAVGAMAVLLSPSQQVWQIVGMGLVTAVTSALLLPVSFLTDKPKSRRAGLLAVAAVLVEYVLVVVLIWDVPRSMGGRAEEFTFTALLLPSVALPAVALLRMTTIPSTRIAGIVGVVLAAVEFIVLMIAVWADRLLGGGQWYATSAAGAIFIPMAIACLIGAGTSDRRWWRWIGLVIVTVSLAGSLVGIWKGTGDHPAPYVIIVTLAALFGYANLAMQVPLKPGQGWMRWATLLSVLVTAGCVDAAIILDDSGVRDPVGRVGAAAGILGGCGTLALLILAALNRRVEAPAVAIADVHKMTVVCPLCQKKQVMVTGGAACSGCALRIVIRLEEPRCTHCGYLLYGLTSDRCPECGTATSGVQIAPVV